MSFVQRLISISVQLASNTQTNQPNSFSESGTDTVTLTGSRASVRISNSGAPADGRAQVKIWGMTPSLMNQLATLGLVFNIVPKNTLTISAGDSVSGMSAVFSGTIYAAYGDYSAQPDVPFIFECLSGVANATAPAISSSFAGTTDVATIMSGIARQMNVGFENNNVSVQIANPYLSGSLKTQADKIAEHAGIEYGIFNGNLLAIWPKGGNRKTPNIPVISAETGMVGYPAFTQQGIIVKTIFNTQISFGSLITVQSSLLSGIASSQSQQGSSVFPTQWAVNKLDLSLDSMFPKGDWLSTIFAYNPGYSKAIIPPAS
jgi:hypothetical protein